MALVGYIRTQGMRCARRWELSTLSREEHDAWRGLGSQIGRLRDLRPSDAAAAAAAEAGRHGYHEAARLLSGRAGAVGPRRAVDGAA